MVTNIWCFKCCCRCFLRTQSRHCTYFFISHFPFSSTLDIASYEKSCVAYTTRFPRPHLSQTHTHARTHTHTNSICYANLCSSMMTLFVKIDCCCSMLNVRWYSRVQKYTTYTNTHIKMISS